MAAAPAMTRNPSANSNKPKANFAGREMSLPRRARASHKAATTGARVITKMGLNDWSHPAGTSNGWPREMTRCVKRSAKMFRDEPACSNPAQNIAEAMNNTITTRRRFFSV